MRDNGFSGAAQRFAAATGTAPPSKVYAIHPACEALTELIQERVGKPWSRCPKGHWHAWAEFEARQMLRELVQEGEALSDAGVSASELREFYADMQRGREEIHREQMRDCRAGRRSSVSWPRKPTPSMRLEALMADLIDRDPPNDPQVLTVWRAIRECPPPDLSLMREDAPEWEVA